MNNIVIKTIQPFDILRVDTAEKNDIVSDVFTGNVLHRDKDIPVYFKAYAYDHPHVAIGDRGMLNEIIGYLICNLYKVPQPEQAFLVLMPKDSLTHLWSSLSDRLKKSYETNDVIPMFATQRMYAKALSLRYNHSRQAVERELINWTHFKEALICDEIMGNTDRLPRNILTANSKHFWLIDNGKLAIEDGTNWQSTDLIEHNNYSNYLADLVIKDMQADSKKGNLIIQTALKKFKAIRQIIAECEFWIDALSSNQDREIWQKFLAFLQSRDHNITHILSERYGMLSL